LETLFVLDAAGRIVSTREPQATSGPAFHLIRGITHCAWAVRADVSDEVAEEMNRLAGDEPPVTDFRKSPMHADRYVSLIGGRVRSGPAFHFPQTLIPPSGVVMIEDEELLGRHFHGWVPGEIAAGCAPMMAMVEGGYPVSICFSARWSETAAEAGIETAAEFRGRGFGPRVAAAWALEVRALGRIPLYSTDWSNTSSLAVARKLHLEPYAADWSVG
jgi:hypothetical protein